MNNRLNVPPELQHLIEKRKREQDRRQSPTDEPGAAEQNDSAPDDSASPPEVPADRRQTKRRSTD